PQALGLILTGSVNPAIISSPAPVSKTVAGGTTQYFTWIYNAGTQTGTISFTGRAIASDANAGWAVDGTQVQSNDVSVLTSAVLSSSIIIPDTDVSVGQVITVIMSVTNDGGATANTVNANVLTIYNDGSGSASLASGPVPSNITLNSTQNQLFTFTYNANQAGVIYFSGNARGNDSTFGLINSSISNSAAVSIQNAVSLGATITASPEIVSTGQRITVVMAVTNNGQATAVGAIGVTPTTTGGGSVVLLTSPNAVNISGGATEYFTWTYSANSSGTINFTSRATAVDINSSLVKTSPALTSSNIIIRGAAVLAAEVSGPQVVANDGTVYALTMTVTNNGQADALNVVPNLSYINIAGDAVASVITGPVPATAVIDGLSNTVFVWTYSVQGSGTIQFTSLAYGVDEYSGAQISAAANILTNVVQTPQPLLTKPSVTSLPAQVTIGQVITVVAGVTNNGLADSIATSADAYAAPGSTANVVLLSGPSPSSAVIPGNGGYAQFTWTFSADGSGAVWFNASAYTGAISSPVGSGNTVTVQSQPALTISYQPIVSPKSVGQQITVIMNVNNSGEAAANNTVPLVTVIGDASSLTLISGPVPGAANITGGSSAAYTWRYSTTNTGTVSFYGEAQGADANSGLIKTAAPVTSSQVILQSPATLTANLLLPSTVSLYQVYTVVMQVSNTGSAAAVNVAPPSALNLTGSTGSSIKVSGPAPAVQTIAGSSSAFFTWTYSAVGTGSMNFSGNAAGTDGNSGAVVTSTNASRGLIIEKASKLTSVITASPDPAKTGEQVTVIMAVSNETGAATAMNVSVTPQALEVVVDGLARTVNTVSIPSPVSRNISGGLVSYFTWVYQLGSGNGSVSFSANAIGTDGNAGWAVQSGKVSGNIVEVNDSAVLASELSVNASTVSAGQFITVYMTVTNSGGAASNNTNANPLVVFGNGSAVSLIPVSPSNVVINSLASQVFTYTYSASGSGTVYFSGNATGTDSTFGAVSSAVNSSQGVIIETAVNFAANIRAYPSQVSVGQMVTVDMTVTNNGQADALNVNGLTPLISGTGVLTADTTPVNQTIAGNSSANFRWIYQATTPGTVSLTTRAQGTDENSSVVKQSGVLTSPVITIQSPASLTASITAAPSTVGTTGFTVTVIMAVTNNGQAAANAVTPTGFAVEGTAGYTIAGGPSPVSLTITGGSTGYFTWILNPTSTGILYVTANAAGTDNNSGLMVQTAAQAQSNNVAVQPNVPVLLSWINVTPSVINQNQMYSVIMSVSNTGVVPATATAPDPIVPILDSVYVSGPDPSTSTIPAGGYAGFTWVYRSAGTTGTDVIMNLARSLGEVSTDITSGSSNSLQVVADASLAQDIFIVPSTVSVGQTITVRINVTNTGGSLAEGVVPLSPIKIGTGNFSYLTGPVPSSVNIASGANAWFTWTYQSTAAGNLAVNTSAIGYSTYSKATVTSAASDSNYINVEAPASLSSSIYTPAAKNIGQWLTVTMVVTNTGNANAVNVKPLTSLILAGTGGAIRMNGPSPAAATIAGGTSQVYQWTYSAAGAGTVTFSGNASGADGNSGAAVSSPASVSNVLTVQTGSSLSVVISASPAVVGTGYPITVTGVITNNGQATANNVRMNELDDVEVAVSGGNATLATGVVPSAGVVLAGGASASFTWTYTANTIGTINFTGIATGVDNNTNLGVTSTAAVSNNVEIRNAAYLSSDINLLPAAVSVGQQVTVLMNVTNTGLGAADFVTGENIIQNGTATLTYVSGPSPATQSIAGGASSYITWIYTAATAGTVNVNGNARAVDANLGNTITSATATSNTITIESAAALAAQVSAAPAQVSVGQV
ncbi:MAG TPA: hypothetical protein PKZ78_05870, partial [Candidatus Goldiibacteriota bacterium]|nr:hypothetical protein [Candidatus Goldiibacteriota bacterium]